ncbi:MAG: hypothetical protein WAU01_01410 [Saprospiraceae bacterium]
MSAYFLLPVQLHAQKKYTKSDVRQMFPASTKNLWINYLSGTIDGTHIVDMIIGTDGQTCKGVYTMRNSQVSFIFEGEEIDDQVHLIEYNTDMRASGFLKGRYDGEIFEGDWLNGDKNLTFVVKLSFVNSFEVFQPKKCLQKQWQRLYSALIDNQSVQLSIAKDELEYKLCLRQQDKRMKSTVKGKGKRVEMLEFDFENTVLKDKWIMIDTSTLEKIDIVSIDENQYQSTYSVKADAILDFECFEYADYTTRMECVLPVSQNKKFNKYIEDYFTSWFTDNTKRLQSIKKDDVGTKDRWKESASGWVDIDLFTGELISGNMYMNTSLAQGTQKKSFIYDLKNNKLIQLVDFFDDKVDCKGYFENIISDKKKNIPWKQELKSWISQQDFAFVTLKDIGFCFSTDFNTIYGEREILIPYEDVEISIKDKYLLKDIVRK